MTMSDDELLKLQMTIMKLKHTTPAIREYLLNRFFSEAELHCAWTAKIKARLSADDAAAAERRAQSKARKE